MNPMGPIPDLFALNDEQPPQHEPAPTRTTSRRIWTALVQLARRIRAALTKPDPHYPTDYSSSYRP